MDDLISRQNAIDALENHACYGIEELDNLCNASVADSEGWLGGIRDAIREIEAVPSAEPERIIKIGQRSGKTLESAIYYLHSVGWLQEHDRILTESAESVRKKGEWVYDGIRGRFPACKCSICGHYENADWALLQGANFCPNCGADMRGDHE